MARKIIFFGTTIVFIAAVCGRQAFVDPIGYFSHEFAAAVDFVSAAYDG